MFFRRLVFEILSFMTAEQIFLILLHACFIFSIELTSYLFLQLIKSVDLLHFRIPKLKKVACSYSLDLKNETAKLSSTSLTFLGLTFYANIFLFFLYEFR